MHVGPPREYRGGSSLRLNFYRCAFIRWPIPREIFPNCRSKQKQVRNVASVMVVEGDYSKERKILIRTPALNAECLLNVFLTL